MSNNRTIMVIVSLHFSLYDSSHLFTITIILKACFGSPKFDRKEPIHILSADSRFPDIRPGEQLSSGNHFMTIVSKELLHSIWSKEQKENKKMKKKKLYRRKKSAGVRGGGAFSSDTAICVKQEKQIRRSRDVDAASTVNAISKRKRQRQQQHQQQSTNNSLNLKTRGDAILKKMQGIFLICQSFIQWVLC